jgi:hypothetical protein
MTKAKQTELTKQYEQTAILAAAIRAYILEQGSTSIKITESGRNNPEFCHGMVVVHEDANKALFISVMTEVEFEEFQREQQAETEIKE